MSSRPLIKLLGLSILAAVSVMAVSASTAQGAYKLLLNGVSVSSLTLTLEGLAGYMRYENGLKIGCSGGTGGAKVESKESGATVTGTASATFKGCVWVGSEKTCIINDGGSGLINAKGSGEVSMDASNYTWTATSSEFATIFTEGPFCTIPEEEVISGTLSFSIPAASAEANTTVKTGTLKADNLKLGNLKVVELVGQLHVRDVNPLATWAIHL